MADTPAVPNPADPDPAKPEAATPDVVVPEPPPAASEAKTEQFKPQPFKPEGTSPAAPAPKAPERWVPEGTPAPSAGLPGSPYTPPRPKRTSAEIRADIDAQRQQLGQNVDHLRDKVTEITDWRGQLLKHRKKIVVGAVATGFVVGGLMALRRR